VTRTALIVGAGIGGLSAGLALRRAGWNIRIFERASSPRELGFGLLVAPNAIAALRELGVADTVLERGFSPLRGELRRMDGTVVKRADFPPPEALGGPTVVALRSALHGGLLEALGQADLTLGAEVVGFEAEPTGVSARLADGQTARGDLLIGADGVGSIIRRALHPHERPPRQSGIVAVRGAVHGAVQHLQGLSAVYYLGRGVESFLVRASETGIYWALSLARQIVPPGLQDPAAILRHMSPRMDETFRAVTMNTEEMRYDELVDRDPLPFWGQGRVSLLGDAAHPVLPHTGQGAAQAIVDGVTLGRLLRTAEDVGGALRAYERERRDKTVALLHQGRRTAAVMGMTNPIGCHVREIAVRLIPVRPLGKLFARINRRAGTDLQR
jgi:2-polyprenyl-6-methoxyphenol hydroxylase-like FAD-dependent oxidoreductase